MAALAPVAMVVAAGTGIAHASSIHVPSKYASGIRMAMDATYPPDEFIQNGHIVGFDADLGQALGKVMGVKVTMVDATFDTIIPGIVDGKFDVGNSSFTDTKAREGQVQFIDYFRAGEGFYERANSTHSFNGLKALCGHTVAVETGTTEQCDAQTQAKSCHVTVLLLRRPEPGQPGRIRRAGRSWLRRFAGGGLHRPPFERPVQADRHALLDRAIRVHRGQEQRPGLTVARRSEDPHG